MASLNERGKRSVGDSEVRIKAEMKREVFNMFFSLKTNHNATPSIAIMNVGDSALWLKMTTQINIEQRI